MNMLSQTNDYFRGHTRQKRRRYLQLDWSSIYLNATQSSQTVHEHFHTIPTHVGRLVKFSTESCSKLLKLPKFSNFNFGVGSRNPFLQFCTPEIVSKLSIQCTISRKINLNLGRRKRGGGKWVVGGVRCRESSGKFPKYSEKFLEFPERTRSIKI